MKWLTFAFLMLHSASLVADDSFRTVSELMQRVAAEREKLVQYSVDVIVTGAIPSAEELFQKTTTSQSKTDLQIEYSRLSHHFLTLACFDPESAQKEWLIAGANGNFVIEGSSKTQISIKEYDPRTTPRPNRQHTELRVFDPRAVGLLDAKQFGSGCRYELSVSAMTHAKEGSKAYKKDGNWVAEWPLTGVKIVFDPDKSYWPVSFDLIPKDAGYEQHWKVKVVDHFGTFVPKHAEFEVVEIDSRSRRKSTETVTFDFEWEVINQFIRSGIPAAERLRDRFSVPLVVE